MKNHYEVLGVDKTASADDIKAAYKKKAKEFHPDLNPDNKASEESFKEVANAFAVLGDEQKRAEYDQPRSNPFMRDENYTRTLNENEYEDLFKFFRSPNQKPNFNRASSIFSNKDIVQVVHLTLEEFHNGTKRTISVNNKSMVVSVPPGTAIGSAITVHGRGETSNHKLSPGNLIVKLNVIPHNVWKLQDNDIFCYKEIDAWQAILGCDVDIPLISGSTVRIHVPSGCQTKQQFKLPKKGLNVKNELHDAYLVINVTIPRITPDQQLKLKQLLAEINNVA